MEVELHGENSKRFRAWTLIAKGCPNVSVFRVPPVFRNIPLNATYNCTNQWNITNLIVRESAILTWCATWYIIRGTSFFLVLSLHALPKLPCVTVWSIRKAPMDIDRFTSHGTTYKHKFSCESPLSYTSQSLSWSLLSKVALCSIQYLPCPTNCTPKLQKKIWQVPLHEYKNNFRYHVRSPQQLETGFEVSKTTLNYVFLRRRHWSSQRYPLIHDTQEDALAVPSICQMMGHRCNGCFRKFKKKTKALRK